MDARQWFLETMGYGSPDHVPYMDQAIREVQFAYALFDDSRVYRELVERESHA
jgi:hypothetical protein